MERGAARVPVGTLVLTLDNRTALFLHDTAAHEDDATAAAVTRRLWSLREGERTAAETVAALGPAGGGSDDPVYRRPSLTSESLLVALHDGSLSAALRLAAARHLATQGADGARAVREAAGAWVDEDSRRALDAMTA